MSLQDLGSIGEFVAAIATIVTLVYLALQIRQNSESVRMQAEIGVSEQIANWAGAVARDPRLSRIWDKAAATPDELDDEERSAFVWLVAELFFLYEGQWNLYRKGHISGTAWGAKVGALIGLISNPIIEKWWDNRTASFSPEVVAYLDEKRKEPVVTWTHQDISNVSKPTPNK